MTDYYIELTLQELCDAMALPEHAGVELVELGVLQPRGAVPAEWLFDAHMVAVARRAARLHRDLELDWSAVAMVLDLLEQRERLRLENRRLHQLLSRFLLE